MNAYLLRGKKSMLTDNVASQVVAATGTVGLAVGIKLFGLSLPDIQLLIACAYGVCVTVYMMAKITFYIRDKFANRPGIENEID